MSREDSLEQGIQVLPASAEDETRMRMRIINLALELFPLIDEESPKSGLEEIIVTMPEQEGDRLSLASAKALRISEENTRTDEEAARMKDILGEIASTAKGFETGSSVRERGTTAVCMGLKDASGEIRLCAASTLREWAEPSAMEHLEKVWLRKENTDHLLRLNGTPTLDAAAALTTMKDITNRFPDMSLTSQQQEIIEGRL